MIDENFTTDNLNIFSSPHLYWVMHHNMMLCTTSYTNRLTCNCRLSIAYSSGYIYLYVYCSTTESGDTLVYDFCIVLWVRCPYLIRYKEYL